MKKILLILLLLLLAYVAYVLVSTGFFRSIENRPNDVVLLQKIAIKGAEDIVVSHADSFALISATNRNVYPPQTEEFGDLHLLDLSKKPFETRNLTADIEVLFAPHGISMFKMDSTYRVMAINHTSSGHSIEVFDLVGEQLIHKRTIRHASLVSPNDLVLIDETRFYFTNDHGYTEGIGKFFEEYVGLSVSNVVYFDGETYNEVASGIAYANGINFDSERNLLFVASARGFLVNVYSIKSDGSLAFIEDIPCGTGVDNIEFDREGDIWIGCHPNLLRFTAYAKGKKETSPSEIIKIHYRGKKDYSIDQVWMDDGGIMSASTVAAPFGDLILAGNVKDDAFIILDKENKSSPHN